MIKSFGYGTHSAQAPLDLLHFERRAPKERDVLIDILYCGVCHSDLHTARNEWGNTVYPVVPGHEIVGRVASVGDKVTKFKTGDMVGVGCLVGSCRHCRACDQDLEQYCENGWIGTYNGEEMHTGGMTYSGYANNIAACTIGIGSP